MNNILEILISIALLAVLGSFLNPMHLFMPDTVNTMLTLGLIIGFLIFVGLVWQEKGNDEREVTHIQKSGRLSFFIGLTVLVIGIVSQAVSHNVDPWLLYALSAMVITKVITRTFYRLKN